MQIRLGLPKDSLTILIGLNVGVFVLLTALAMLAGPSLFERLYSDLLITFGALNSTLVLQFGQVWRAITSQFLHVDLLHLAFNMFALFQLGRVVRDYYGGRLLWVFYILSGLGAAALSLMFLDPRFPSVGASGAVFGILGVLVAGTVRKNTYGLELPFRLADILPLAIYAFLFGLIPNSGVNNFAHLGGFLTGLLLGWFFSHSMVTWKPKWQTRLEKVLFYATIIFVVIAYLFAIANFILTINS